MLKAIKKTFLPRHLVKRHFRNLSFSISGKKLVPSNYLDTELIFPHLWYDLNIPIVNHPSQSHLLETKKFNMRLACKKIDSLIIPKNQIFSFWNIIEKPTAENGFKAGPTFEYGEIVSSFGGGLCQISGLLFNLALHSGLKIHERHPHSIDAYGDKRYLPLGKDATVSFFTKDLCFENDSGSDLQLKIYLQGDNVFGELRAQDNCSYSVHIENVLIPENEDSGLFLRKAKVIRRINYKEFEKTEDFGWNFYKVPKE